MRVGIRADGGPKLGYGHLIRSRALSEELLSRGHTITVATTTPGEAGEIFPNAVEKVALPSRDNPGPFVEWIDANQPDVVFTDAYPVDTEYQQAIRERVPLAVLQDDARHTVCADLFINGNLYAKNLDYEFIDPQPACCLGTEYLLLRKEIRDYAEKEPPTRSPPERALITMGASDVAELTPSIIHAFDGFDIHVDAIVGPGCSIEQEQTIRKSAASVSTDIDVIRNPENLAELMFEADFAVSTASSTTYELLALGTPLISIPVVDNQELIATALRSQNIATVVTLESEKSTLQAAIKQYILEAEHRLERQQVGKKIVDGKRTKRVADGLAGIVEQ